MSYIGNSPLSIAFLTDTFSGNGSTVAFTMTVAPANTSSIIVAITGVLQDPSTYSVSGTTLTFSAAPPSGTSNISVRYLGIPASGVTTTAYRTVTDFTATAAQTSFSVPSYTVGYIDVYRNGVRLVSTDFTATTGTTVVLVNACTSGDSVVTESFFVSSVLNAIPATAGSISLTSATYLSGILPVAYGGTGVATSTGTGAVVLGTSPTLTTPTLTSPTISGTPAGVGVLTSGTATATTSGTSIDFTSIPSWVKRITVMLAGVSTNGGSNHMLQIGDSGGIENTSYVGSALTSGGAGVAFTTGYGLAGNTGSTSLTTGVAVIALLNSSTNLWAYSFCGAYPNDNTMVWGGGYKSLSATLDRLRLTTVNGTDTFDAGSINILYE